MLQAVHVIHEEKIVHSDLKPANFVLVRGQLKLIDFGIANAIANDTTNIQRDHQVGHHEIFCRPFTNLLFLSLFFFLSFFVDSASLGRLVLLIT